MSEDLWANARAAFAEWQAREPEPPRWPTTEAELRDALRQWARILPQQTDGKR